ncbi:MAG: adenylate/guanylate cyclase domain-containing protein [Nitrospirae bacterium]|nr:adenylate/guanylate cyclase domain-containing protein [Nitrospirota bacterium]
MMNYNHQLQKGFRIFTIEMCAFISNKLRELYGESWRDKLSQQLQTSTLFSDVIEDNTGNVLLSFEQISRVVEDLWDECFSSVFKNKTETITMLNNTNKFFITVTLSAEMLTRQNVWRAMNTMASLIKYINKDAAIDINSIVNNEILEKETITTPPSTINFQTTETYFNYTDNERNSEALSINDINKLLKERERIDKKLEDKFKKDIAVMFTDLKGSTSLADVEGDIISMILLQKNKEIIIPIIKKNNGVLVKTMGDGTLSYFTNSNDALNSAIQIIEDAASYNENEPHNRRLHLRIGIHKGKCIVEKDDIFGDVVNVASRFENLAIPGEIAISEDTYNGLCPELRVRCKLDSITNIDGKKSPFKVYRVCGTDALQKSEIKCQKVDYIPFSLLKDKSDPNEVYSLTVGEFIIGRSIKCDIVLKEEYISRQHAKIIIDHNSASIEDLNSLAGTRINNEKITHPCRLKTGDEIMLGHKVIIYENPMEGREDGGSTVPLL